MMGRGIYGLFCVLCACELLSCAGYRLRKRENPLSNDGVRSISIPMFFNQSNIPNASSIFTREFFKIFHEFNQLKVYSGDSPQSDALLIGIITSPKRRRETFQKAPPVFTDPNLSESLGARPRLFYSGEHSLPC